MQSSFSFVVAPLTTNEILTFYDCHKDDLPNNVVLKAYFFNTSEEIFL